MNNLTQQIEETRERYGLLLAGLDSMNEKKTEASDNISRILNKILGASGIYGYYYSLFSILKLVAPQSTLDGSSTAPGYLSIKLLGTLKDEGEDVGTVYKGGLGSTLFGEPEEGTTSETNFEIDYSNDDFVLKTGVVASTIASENFVTRAEAIRTTYAYLDAEAKAAIQAITDEVIAWPEGLATASAQALTLPSLVLSNLNSALETEADNSFWCIPDLSSIASDLNSLSALSTDWTADVEAKNEDLQNYSSGSTLPINMVNAWIDAIETGMSAYSTILRSLLTKVEEAFEFADTPAEITGFRKHWLYWILMTVDRPQSYRMDYNGAVQAITSLNKQEASARTAVELVTSNNEVLPTPELNAFYKDPDTGEYVAVFTTIPCYDSVILRVGSEQFTYNYDTDVVNNSEVKLARDSIDPALDISVKITRTSGNCSEYSNVLHAPEAIS